jgi:hypothetical protein
MVTVDVVLHATGCTRHAGPWIDTLCDDGPMANRRDRPFWVRTDSYALSRSNAIFAVSAVVILTVVGIIVAVTTRHSLGLIVTFLCLAALLAIQSVASAAWLRRRGEARSVVAGPPPGGSNPVDGF